MALSFLVIREKNKRYYERQRPFSSDGQSASES